jgi:hypothetical protein
VAGLTTPELWSIQRNPKENVFAGTMVSETLDSSSWGTNWPSRRRWCCAGQILPHCPWRSSSEMVLSATTTLSLQLGRSQDEIHAGILDISWNNSRVIRPVQLQTKRQRAITELQKKILVAKIPNSRSRWQNNDHGTDQGSDSRTNNFTLDTKETQDNWWTFSWTWRVHLVWWRSSQKSSWTKLSMTRQ